MKFNLLDEKLRIYETAHDQVVLPNIYMVARIDGRGFTRLTKEKHNFDKPFDSRFRDMMVETTKHLMTCGFDIVYGYTQSDEISLLFALNENAFARKLRKFNSILAGEASARFSLLLGDMAAFDCRISQLPRIADVVDYFRWRSEDAHRNALSAHCYWLLRKKGQSAVEATAMIQGKAVSYKNELLFENGINFNNIASWQKRGIGFYWNDFEKKGWNPVKNQEETVMRRAIKVDMELPKADAYNNFVLDLLSRSQ